MAEYVAVCRICLAHNVRLFPIADVLQLVYEKVSNTALFTEDMRPLTVCYICCGQLHKFYQLMLTSAISEKKMTELLKRNPKLTTRLISLIDRKGEGLTGSLAISPPECIDVPAPRIQDAGEMEIKTEEHQGIFKSEFSDLEDAAQSVQSETPTQRVVEENSTIIYEELSKEIKTEENWENGNCDINSEKLYDCESSDNEEAAQSAHLEKLTPAKENSTNIVYSCPKNPTEEIFCECHICHKQFKQVSALKRHFRTHMGDKGYKCKYCEYTCTRLHDLIVHNRTHSGEKPFKCSHCEHSSTTKSSLKVHIRSHTGEKPYTCNYCQHSFSTNGNLKFHLRMHTGAKPFSCEICQREFSRRDHLKSHVKLHTSTEKQHQCNVCHTRFHRKYNLDRHMIKHTGEKKYKKIECNICKHKFLDKFKLEIHLRKHTGEKPYQCDICQRRYKHKISIKTHLIENDGYKLYKCKKCRKQFHHKIKGRLVICKTCSRKSDKH